MSDAYAFLAALDSRDSGNRLRLGMARVRSVDGDPVYGTAVGKCVIVPPTGDWDTGGVVATYLGEYPPRPGAGVWYATDGTDRIVLGMVAPEGPPTATLDIPAATAIATASSTKVVASTIVVDPWNMSNGTGFTVPVAGFYQLTAQAVWASNATGYRQVSFVKNSSALDSERRAAGYAVNLYQIGTSRPISCAKGDTLSVNVAQDSGGNLNLNECTISVTYLGRRRTNGTGNELLTDGDFEDGLLGSAIDPTWSPSILASSYATWTLDTGANAYAGAYAAKGVFSGATLPGFGPLMSNTVLAVVPGQKIRVTARVKTSKTITAGLNDGLLVTLYCSPDGTAAEGDPGTQLVRGAYTSTTTSYALYTWDITVPADCFVARLALDLATASSITVWWDDVSVKEVIN